LHCTVAHCCTPLFSPDAAELNLSLQLFQQAGVLLGLALQSAVAVDFPLPGAFLDVLCNDLPAAAIAIAAAPTAAALGVGVVGAGVGAEAGGTETGTVGTGRAEHVDISNTLALALRTGVLSIVPEQALELLSRQELGALLSMRCNGSPPAAALARYATYEAGLSADDRHITLFWMAVYELSPQQVRRLLLKTLPCSANTAKNPTSGGMGLGGMGGVGGVGVGGWDESGELDEYLYGASGVGSGEMADACTIPRLHLLPPTDPSAPFPSDADSLQAFPHLCALSVPRYRSLQVMTQSLLLFID
ncbi:hypothetical protein B484DRAFT_397107, partial [Ochromonadaceae sp. CCMP2298]